MEYIAKITKEGRYTLAEFPDCPGCQTFSEPGEDLTVLAQDALSGWLEAHLMNDEAPPRPTTRRIRGGRSLAIEVPVTLAVRLALRWAREDEHLTQAQLARRVGVSQQQLAKLEGPRANPTIATLAAVAKGLGRHLSIELVSSPELRFAK